MLRNWFPIALVVLFLLALPGFVLFAADLLGHESDVNSWMERSFGLSHHVPLESWAAVLLFLVPVGIVILYFLKLKRKPQAVSSTFLWKKSIEDLHVNRLLQWLRRNVLLLLQLLVILSLLYAVIAPRLHGATGSGRHYILMVDHSASMSATDGETSRLEWAKAQAIREIDAATDDDFGMVVAFSATAEIRQSYTGNRGLLRQAVLGIGPTQEPTRLDEALALAESLANPTRSTENEGVKPLDVEPGKERTYVPVEGIPTEVHLISDGRFPEVADFALTNLSVQYHAAGTPGTADNVAIVGLDARREEIEVEDAVGKKIEIVIVEARVLNYRDERATGKLKLDVQIDGVPSFFDRPLDIPARSKQAGGDGSPRDVPGEQVAAFEFRDIEPNADVTLVARLEGISDALSVDDEAFAVLGIVRKAQVLIVGPSNPVLKFAFDARATRAIADVTYVGADALADPNQYLDPARSGKYDLVIFDRCGPAGEVDMPQANTLFVGHPPPPWDADKLEKVPFPRVVGWTDQHPAMRGLRGWYELQIAEAFRLTDLPPRTPKLLEGDRGLPLMVALSRSSFTDIVIAFPLETRDAKWNTQWFLRPLFPLFLWQLLHSSGNVRDAATEETVRPGQIKRLRPSGVVPELTVTDPDGKTTKLERGARTEFLFGGTDAVGIYDVTWGDEERRFAVNLFDAEESNVTPRAEFRIGSELVTAGVNRRQPRELWKWAVGAALLFLVAEWWVYNKRVYV